MNKLKIALFSLPLLLAAPAQADVAIGGFTFDDNAFVDTLTESSGSFSVVGGSLATAVTDTSAETYAFSFDQGAFLDLAFTDNVAVNGAGNDIVLFELGTPDTWTVTINGITQNYMSASTGSSAGGFALLASAFDLDVFGIASGGSVSSLRLGFVPSGTGTVVSTALVGALNSAPVGAVPEPGTWAMMLIGFGGIGYSMRRRRKATSAAQMA